MGKIIKLHTDLFELINDEIKKAREAKCEKDKEGAMFIGAVLFFIEAYLAATFLFASGIAFKFSVGAALMTFGGMILVPFFWAIIIFLAAKANNSY